MSVTANSLHIHVVDASADEVCRDERCEVVGVHSRGNCIKLRGREPLYRTRSRKHSTQPWRAYSYEALHESVFNAISSVEPRCFATVLAIVQNDYGSCCERSVHRHLAAWRNSGEIVRMDFKARIHAYLRAGSRLLADPALVFEQMIDVHAEAMSWAEDGGVKHRGKVTKPEHAILRGDALPPVIDEFAEGTGANHEPWRRRNGGMTDAAREGVEWCSREAARLGIAA